jgi:hypothetical protein
MTTTAHNTVLDAWDTDGRSYVFGTVIYTLSHDDLEAIADYYNLERPLWPPAAAQLATIRGKYV